MAIIMSLFIYKYSRYLSLNLSIDITENGSSIYHVVTYGRWSDNTEDEHHRHCHIEQTKVSERSQPNHDTPDNASDDGRGFNCL